MSVLDIISSPWAITPAKLDQIVEAYGARVRGEESDWLARAGQVPQQQRQPYRVVDGVAVVDVQGVIAQRMNLFSQISGGTSSQMLASDIDAALEDQSVDGIVLNIDSPGGAVAGTPEVVGKILSVRGKKPIAAWTDGTMASAAYWIGSAADSIFISSGVTQVGSIGVVASHRDYSKAEAMDGVKTTEIYAGKFKRIASSYEPLTQEGRASIQDQVDYLYSIFVGAVSANRGAPLEDVLSRMADGKIFVGKQAIDAGLVDGMASLQEVIESVRGKAAAMRGAQQKERYMSLTVDQVKQEHAAIASALQAEGAAAERARIKQIQAAALPGHEVLVAKLIEDGTSTADSALQMLTAEKESRQRAGSDRRADAEPALPNAQAASDEPLSQDQKVVKAREFAAANDVSFAQAFQKLYGGR